MIVRFAACFLVGAIFASPALASNIQGGGRANNPGYVNFQNSAGCNASRAAAATGLAITLATVVPLLARRRPAR